MSKEALGMIETHTIAAAVSAVDAALKGTAVSLVELRLADDLGGKAIAIYSGVLEEIEAAIQISRERTTRSAYWFGDSIIPRIHGDMAAQINNTTRFADMSPQALENGEL